MFRHTCRSALKSALGLACAATLAAALANPAAAADKKQHYTPDWNDPTVGALGKTKSSDPVSGLPSSAKAPSAPIAAPALPKVDAGTAVIPGLPPGTQSAPAAAPSTAPAYGARPTTPAAGTASPSEPNAAPRPSVQAEGAPAGAPAPAPMGTSRPQLTSGFWFEHPFASGIVGGFFGIDIGESIIGGSMVGDETAVMVGYGLRVGLILLPFLLLVRWAMRRQSSNPYADSYAQRGHGGFDRGGFDRGGYDEARREPSFDRGHDTHHGRREPSLHIAPDERRPVSRRR